MYKETAKKLPAGLLSVAEAAQAYGVHPATVRRWIYRGLVPAYQVGERRIGVKPADLAKVVKPRAAGVGGDESMSGIAVSTGLTKKDQERARRLVARIRRRREEIAAQQGSMSPPSWVIINEDRERRGRRLMGEAEDED